MSSWCQKLFRGANRREFERMKFLDPSLGSMGVGEGGFYGGFFWDIIRAGSDNQFSYIFL
jgi:hypothetical protein